jgi:deazaflavin-dependent oxidoreductase (nitroreductase family)
MMTTDEDVQDSPVGWVAKHIRTYVDSGGMRGHIRWGVPTLLFTTRGRKTGRKYRTALIYQEDEENYIVVGSNGGAKKNPSWYLNIRANSEVEVQVGPDKFPATARLATPEERPRLWKQMVSIWPEYDNYQRKVSRQIPVVVIERV